MSENQQPTTGIEVVFDSPISIERVVTEKRPLTLTGYRIKLIEESPDAQQVRVCISLEGGGLVWLTAFSGQAYVANVDWSQAELESAIKEKLLLGQFEG